MDENLCPECSSKMVSRKRKSDGARFWECSNFPACKGTRDSMGRSKSDRDREFPDPESEAQQDRAINRPRWDRD